MFIIEGLVRRRAVRPRQSDEAVKMPRGLMLSKRQFNHDGLTYLCVRRMTQPPIGAEKGDIPRMAYWYVVRSDGANRKMWVPRGQEFDTAGLQAATLQEFGVSDS